MILGTAILALWIDIDPSVRDECDAWYVKRHIADRIAIPGWRRARRYGAVGSTRPATLALYEARHPEDLISEDYLRLQREVDETDRRMRAAFRNVVRDTFKVEHSVGAGEGGFLLSLGFQPDPGRVADGAGIEKIKNHVIASLAALPGVIAVHLLRQAPELRDAQDAHRKSGSDDARAHWVLLVEATQLDRVEAVRDRLDRDLYDDGLGIKAGRKGIYQLMYAVRAA